MPLISRTIPNLVQGVSQQPEILRLNSQATSQVNGFSSVVEGLKKRPNTKHLALISQSQMNNAYIHTINRDVSERYIVIIANGVIQVKTIAGVDKTVVMQTNASNYLSSSNAREDFVAVTVADYTYILNKTKTCAMASTTSPAKVEQAIYSVLQGVVSTKYTITIDGSTFSFTSSGTTSDTEAIRNGVKNACGTIANITFTDVGTSSFSIIKSTGTLTVKASDGYGDDASQIVGAKVQNFSELPSPAVNDMVVEITGDANSKFDNYFVKYNATDDLWVEAVKPNTKININPDTMPHVLIRTADGNFRFTQVDGSSYTISNVSYDVPKWGERVCGDEDSNPDPSFIGKKVNDIFFHRNRFGFLADENVIMSRSGEFFQFFTETATDALDTDPVDVASTAKKVSILRSAISFDEDLLLFTDQTQFILSGGTTLTAGNVSINTSTEYENSIICKPIGAGSNVFFSFNKGKYTGIREFFVKDDTGTKQADDITANIPKYIPRGIFKLASATNENILIGLSSESTSINCLYVYQYYVQDGRRLQSAWHKWDFGSIETDKILNMDFIENTLYIINQKSDNKVYLESLDISPAVSDDGANYLTYLDRKFKDDDTGVQKSFNAVTNQTTFIIPYPRMNLMKVVGRVGGSNTAGQEIPTVSQTGSAIVVTGDFSNASLWFGEQYEFLFQFSQQFIQVSDSGGSRISVKDGRLQIRNWNVSFNDTGYFTTEVTPIGRSTSSSTFTGLKQGTGSLGVVNLSDGDFTFAVQSQNDKLTIKIKNDSHLPSNLINANWQGYYVTSSVRE